MTAASVAAAATAARTEPPKEQPQPQQEQQLKTMFDFMPCCGTIDHGYVSSDDEAQDATAAHLSYVGKAAYEVLRKEHPRQHHQSWNVTTGKVIGELDYTPKACWQATCDLPDGHDDWFPEKLAAMIARTQTWCDIMSLGPPDGIFMTKFQEALFVLAQRSKEQNSRIVVRMMFGNIVGMPVNCTVVIRELTKHLPLDHKLQLWVGAWRKGTSWNHAKIIAVDGKYLHTGGHNLWDYHYLKHNPVHDLSMELEGRIANDGHLFANVQWAYIQRKQLTCTGCVVDSMPDALPMILQSRVTVSEYPESVADVFPPMYNRTTVPRAPRRKHDNVEQELEGAVPIISMGRYGAVMRRHKPADDAMVAMLDSAKTIVRLALQDLGPVCIPGTKITLPGCIWPEEYLKALGRIIWTKGVDVEILLSNPNSIPGGLTPTEANYGNGWSCEDVASEVIKTIVKQFPEAKQTELRRKVHDNLRVCFIRVALGSTWEDGTNMGMHAKHFIIDDVASYVGSQNLYICDLAEWGVVIDDRKQVKKMMEEYWNPMWEVSYLDMDVDVQAVMDGLDIDRSAPNPSSLSYEELQKVEEANNFQYTVNTPHNEMYLNTQDKTDQSPT